jgi:hypothetical protein
MGRAWSAVVADGVAVATGVGVEVEVGVSLGPVDEGAPTTGRQETSATSAIAANMAAEAVVLTKLLEPG